VAILVKGEEALLGLVVPHLYVSVIATRDKVWAIKRRTEVNAIHACLMAYQRVVG
jgi:hypothetical protein